MDSDLPPLAAGLMPPAARDFMHRGIQSTASAQWHLSFWPAAAVLAAVAAAWLINAVDWGLEEMRVMVAFSTGSLVATVVLAVGWASEPEEIERWVLRALAATSISVLPLFT